MAQDYTVSGVSPETRTFSTKFGDMVSYKLKFEGSDAIVELAQKQTTKAPVKGDVLHGNIDMSGQFGPKFKKEQRDGGSFGGGFGSSGSGTPSESSGFTKSTGLGGGKFQSDPYTMFLSYAKDIAVALIATKDGFTDEKFAAILESVQVGGKTLYDGRPGAPVEEKAPAPEEQKDVVLEDIDDKPIDLSDIPF